MSNRDCARAVAFRYFTIDYHYINMGRDEFCQLGPGIANEGTLVPSQPASIQSLDLPIPMAAFPASSLENLITNLELEI